MHMYNNARKQRSDKLKPFTFYTNSIDQMDAWIDRQTDRCKTIATYFKWTIKTQNAIGLNSNG